ncbi:hypothetical protein Tco_0035326 [Tanacetum coccineum]
MYAYPGETSMMTLPFRGSIRTMTPHYGGTTNVKEKERIAPNRLSKGETEKEGPEGAEPSITQEPAPRPSILYQPSKTSNLPFPSRLKKQKKDDEDERLLLIFKQIHINLPFLEAMIHMPNGVKVLKYILSHKEKLEKAASSVKLSEECSAIIHGVCLKWKETQEASHCHVLSDP